MLSYEDMANLPTLSIDELITASNDFINQFFVNNQALNNELEDLNNFNYPQLLNLMKQIDNQSEAMFKFNLKPVEQ